VKCTLNEEACGDGPIRRLSQCHPLIQPSLTVTAIQLNTKPCIPGIVSHNNNKHTISARKFPGDFANFQNIYRISRSVRHPGLTARTAQSACLQTCGALTLP